MERPDRPSVATFFTTDSLVAGGTITLSKDGAHHIRVARLALGDPVALRDGAGMTATGVLVRASHSSALIDVSETEAVPRPEPMHLLAPVADRDRMLWLAEKATELGIATWRPVMWSRSRSVSPRGEGAMFRAKTRARMTAALVQSGGAWLPDAFPEAMVENAIAAAPAGTRLLLARDGEPIGKVSMRPPITIALGPEGGIERGEREAFIGAGFVAVTLAETTLRFETAGIAAVAIAGAAAALARRSNG